MAHANTAPDHMESVSVDPQEMANFEAMAADWWNPNGKFKPLHIMNSARVGFIKDALCTHFHRDPNADLPLKGLKLLDIGCGGGLLSEPMTRLGAEVTGVDALAKNVKTAKTHASQMGLEINYVHGTIEQMVEAKTKPFDAVLNMEVIEHVVDPASFLAACAAMVRPGGMMVCSTINRTMKAFVFAIVGAEYVLRWLPRGTHQHSKFITPAELGGFMRRAGLNPLDPVGMSLNPFSQKWSFGSDTRINYVQIAHKPAA